jgi:hypothetical protein
MKNVGMYVHEIIFNSQQWCLNNGIMWLMCIMHKLLIVQNLNMSTSTQMKAKWTLNLPLCRPHPSIDNALQANTSCSNPSLRNVQWRRSRSARTSNLRDYYIVRHIKQRTDLGSLRSRLVGLLELRVWGPSKRAALCAIRFVYMARGHPSSCTLPYSSDQSWAL